MLLPAPPDPALIAYNRQLAAFLTDHQHASTAHHVGGDNFPDYPLQKELISQVPQWRAPPVGNIPKFRGGGARKMSAVPEESSRWGVTRRARDQRMKRENANDAQATSEAPRGSSAYSSISPTQRGDASRTDSTQKRRAPLGSQRPPVRRSSSSLTTPEDEDEHPWHSEGHRQNDDQETTVTVRSASPSSSREVSPDASYTPRRKSSTLLSYAASSSPSMSRAALPFPLDIHRDGLEACMEPVPMLSPCSEREGEYGAGSYEDERDERPSFDLIRARLVRQDSLDGRLASCGQSRSRITDLEAQVGSRRRKALFPVEDDMESVPGGRVWGMLLSDPPSRGSGIWAGEKQGTVRRRIVGKFCMADKSEAPLREETSRQFATLVETEPLPPLVKKFDFGEGSRSSYIPYMDYRSTAAFLAFCRQHQDLVAESLQEDAPSYLPQCASVQMSAHGTMCFGSPTDSFDTTDQYPDHLDASPLTSDAAEPSNSSDWHDFHPPPRRRSDGDLLRKRVLDWNLVLSGKVTQVRVRGEKEPRIRCGSYGGGFVQGSGLRWAVISLQEEDSNVF